MYNVFAGWGLSSLSAILSVRFSTGIWLYTKLLDAPRELPAGFQSARQLSGPRGKWLFEAVAFQRWWESREREVERQWPDYSVEAKHIGLVPSVTNREIRRSLKTTDRKIAERRIRL